MSTEPLLRVNDLQVQFRSEQGVRQVVDSVSFAIKPGQSVGIVGESGSGKSVTCYSLLGLIPQPPGRIHGGSALFMGQDLLKLSERELRAVRGSKIGIIFQDPMTSLNPYLTIGAQVMEPLHLHEQVSKREARQRALDMLENVGIKEPQKRFASYPHEFSGGMRQRVLIAMALITHPKLLICDEPTTALDVTIQAQVLELLAQLQAQMDMALLFITHDLAVVSGLCDQVNVMYAGRFVESAPSKALFTNPRHAYTRSLLKSIPEQQEKGKALISIPGVPPKDGAPKTGCAFAPRNILGDRSLCIEDARPSWQQIETDHYVQHCPGCLC